MFITIMGIVFAIAGIGSLFLGGVGIAASVVILAFASVMFSLATIQNKIASIEYFTEWNKNILSAMKAQNQKIIELLGGEPEQKNSEGEPDRKGEKEETKE